MDRPVSSTTAHRSVSMPEFPATAVSLYFYPSLRRGPWRRYGWLCPLVAAPILAQCHSSQQAVTPQMVRKFVSTARVRMRINGGGYRRDHLRALTQRVEVADKEVRIMGSKSDLLRTLVAGPGAGPATPAVRSSVLKWRRGRDSNPR